MTEDKRRFEKFEQHEGGSVNFGNNNRAKVFGRGTIKINDGKIRPKEVLFVIRLKHSLLSVIQIYGRGHDVISKKYGCEIRRKDSGTLVTIVTMNLKNLYTLIETSKGSYFVRKKDEDWF